MKITIEPTEKDSQHRTISIADVSDDLTSDEALAMVYNALVAWGYHPTNIYPEDE